MKQIKAWELIYLNEKLLERYGGLTVLQTTDLSLRIEALCNRVLSICAYKELNSPAAIAAVYCEVIARGHGFSDANKRTAVNTLYLFLKRNGLVTCVPAGLSDVIVDVATGKVSRQQLTAYIQNNIL